MSDVPYPNKRKWIEAFLSPQTLIIIAGIAAGIITGYAVLGKDVEANTKANEAQETKIKALEDWKATTGADLSGMNATLKSIDSKLNDIINGRYNLQSN